MDKSLLYTGNVKKREGELLEPVVKSKKIKSIPEEDTLQKGDVLSLRCKHLLFDYLWIYVSPKDVFIYMETLPLPVKGYKI
jgi:hypothetical protein